MEVAAAEDTTRNAWLRDRVGSALERHQGRVASAVEASEVATTIAASEADEVASNVEAALIAGEEGPATARTGRHRMVRLLARDLGAGMAVEV